MKRIPIEVPEGVELPERQKKLSFTEWVLQDRSRDFIVANHTERDEMVDKYVSYLNNLPEEKASVIERYALYLDGEIEVSSDTTGVTKVFYNGRHNDGTDLFTVVFYDECPNHAQGTLNGLFIEIDE